MSRNSLPPDTAPDYPSFSRYVLCPSIKMKPLFVYFLCVCRCVTRFRFSKGALFCICIFVFCTLCCPNGKFSHGKLGSLSPRKARCNKQSRATQP